MAVQQTFLQVLWKGYMEGCAGAKLSLSSTAGSEPICVQEQQYITWHDDGGFTVISQPILKVHRFIGTCHITAMEWFMAIPAVIVAMTCLLMFATTAKWMCGSPLCISSFELQAQQHWHTCKQLLLL